jgi:hypothetical protein
MSKLQKDEAVRIMKRRERPDPGREFWDGYWDRLKARMEAEAGAETAEADRRIPAPRPRSFAVPRWIPAAAAGTALLLAGIQIGRLTGPGRNAAGPAAARAAGPDPVLAGRIAEYFTRSKVILLSLANFDPSSQDPAALSPSVQQQVSRELVDRGRELEALLTGPEGKRYKNLIAELKTILVQVANLDPEESAQAAEIVRGGIRLREILFKISISLMSLPAPRGAAAAGL